MTSEQVQSFVDKTLVHLVYDSPPTGSTIGVPWSSGKVFQYRDRLRTALVKPSLKRVLLRDTVDQIRSRMPAHADVWVVAEFDNLWLFFDADASEFGLAQKSNQSDEYVTIGIRGDLVGVYCAA
jgi:hypothetical protein